MLEISYEKLIPYPFEVTLSQYFDYEHIAHVHPRTVGEYRLVEQRGNVLIYDQIWPANILGMRATSRVRHTFEPPDSMRFEFISGRHKGISVHSRLQDRGDSTLVTESYFLPLPNWPWLRPVIRPAMIREIERIWEEDLGVEICIGGWPGVPGRSLPPEQAAVEPVTLTGEYVVGRASDHLPGQVFQAFFANEEIVVVGWEGGFSAVSGRCPHTGGPLALGTVEGNSIVCPWHGARFCLATGRSQCNTTAKSLTIYDVSVMGDDIVVRSVSQRVD